MNYQKTVEYLFSQYPVFEHVGGAAYKEGLSNTLALDAHFGHPHRSYKTIHIAGTNGKGSSAHTLAAVLQKAGYRVGLYTSPHLVDFRERMKVNGEVISEERVIDFVEREHAFFEPLHPSFFELTTALAFLYFKEQQVDVAVIEVGLGGRLDCTNIIHPLLSVITNISIDHTKYLGTTLEKIASEKAGIIKTGVPVVVGEYLKETRPVFEEKAKAVNAPIYFAQDAPEVVSSEPIATGGIRYETRLVGALQGQLSGDYQQRNTNTVLAALRILRENGLLDIPDTAIRDGFATVVETTGLMGRWQVLHREPLTVCDTGHNVGGWQWLSKQIKAQPCKRLRIVFGMVDDKDIDAVLGMLPRSAVYYWTQATSHRAIPVERVRELAEGHGLQGQCFKSVEEAYRQARREAEREDFLFVGGSSYVVADLLGIKEL